MKFRKLHGIAITAGLNLCWQFEFSRLFLNVQLAHFPLGPAFGWGYHGPCATCCCGHHRALAVTLFHRMLGFELTMKTGQDKSS